MRLIGLVLAPLAAEEGRNLVIDYRGAEGTTRFRG